MLKKIQFHFISFTSKAKVRRLSMTEQSCWDRVRIQALENFLTNLFIEIMGIQLFRINIMQHVQCLYLYIFLIIPMFLGYVILKTQLTSKWTGSVIVKENFPITQARSH